ncbi:hypothetical protein Patl1_19695 [Pistacia atlantica]|uniref:Uncharacterized protein n=1 Tax=Pistacia atlantica TaxID=434234 RepID=A0ACC1C2V2_9ROSI|nr:hypothetical protein Patl1_19695 [Pistacia atlantica]
MLHPMRQIVGRWTPDEDKRLTVAAILFGPKIWKKIAQFLPGRTQVQRRERYTEIVSDSDQFFIRQNLTFRLDSRWVISLDLLVNRGEWTGEEDLMLEAALEEHGFSCSKVAAALPARTDSPVLEV